eukprot:427823-Rhodomonas_salina.1
MSGTGIRVSYAMSGTGIGAWVVASSTRLTEGGRERREGERERRREERERERERAGRRHLEIPEAVRKSSEISERAELHRRAGACTCTSAARTIRRISTRQGVAR